MKTLKFLFYVAIFLSSLVVGLCVVHKERHASPKQPDTTTYIHYTDTLHSEINDSTLRK